MTRYTVTLLLTAVLAASAAGQDFGPSEPFPGGGGQQPSQSAAHFKVEAVASHTRVRPGQTFYVALVGELGEGWVYYSPDGGKMVISGSLDVQAGPFEIGRILWPQDKAKTLDLGEEKIVNRVYSKRFAVYAELTVPEDAAAGEVEITLQPQGQICLQQCVNLEGPDALSASAKVTVGETPAANPQWAGWLAEGRTKAMTAEELKASHREPEAGKTETVPPAAGTASAAAAQYTILSGLGLALLAGLTLNIMPCVLPIIPLRIYSLVNMAGESRRRYVTLGLAFAGGVVLFFVALAAVSAAVKLVGGSAIDLNFYFQFSWARVLIAMILLALSANLWGLFNVTVPSKVAGIEAGTKSQGHAAAVGMGTMMAVLSLPCSFWLMALALAWAQLQPVWLGTLAIVTIGVGMALPHVALASFPRLVNVLPKPGVWMEYFKQTMGFLLIPAVLYLLSTLPERGGYPFLVAAFGAVLVFGLWIWGGWVRYDAPLGRKLIVRGAAVGLIAAAGWTLLPEPAAPLVEFEAFDAARVDAARKENVVVVKVTAAWCTECKILDYQVFNTPEAAEAFRDREVIAVKADVTDRSRPASQWVRRNFGGAPPLTIVYPRGGGKPRVMVGRFSKRELFAALDEAAAVSPADRLTRSE